MSRLVSLIGVLAMSVAPGPAAAQSGGPSPSDLDRTALDVLKEIHNKGADLYNTGDAAGCYRMYQGAVVAVRPFLAHRPNAQKLIDAGLAEVAKSSGVKIQAFRLHEVIEQVRAELKAEIKKADAAKIATPAPKDPVAVAPPPPKPPVPTDPMATPKEPLPPAKPPVAPKPPMPPAKPKDPMATPKDPLPPAAKPKDTAAMPPPMDTAIAPPAKDGMVTGKLTLDGKPVAGELTFVSLDLPAPRVFFAEAGAGGSFKVDGPIPTGKYAVMATGNGVPAKFQSVTTSGLTATVRGGPNELVFELKK